MKNYLFVYLGNLIGSLFVSVLFVYGHIPGLYDGLLAQNMVNTAVTKVSLSFSEVFFRGILCNVMVCVAVWMGMSATHVSGKILAVYPPISAFVLLRLRALRCKHVLHSRRYDDRICIRHRCRGLKYRNLYPQQSDPCHHRQYLRRCHRCRLPVLVSVPSREKLSSLFLKKNPALQDSPACGGSRKRHSTIPPQCDPCEAFFFIGRIFL